MGWDEALLQNAVNTCLNPSGKIEDCPLFTIQDEAAQAQCSFDLPAPLASETVIGIVGTTLPGNVAIQTGPQPATFVRPGGAAASAGVPSPAAASPTAPPPAVPSGSYTIDSVSMPSTTASPAASTDSSASTAVVQQITPTPAPAAAPLATPDDAFSTQYITGGDVLTELIWEEEIVYVTEEVTATEVVTIEGAKARRDAHVHRHLGPRRRFRV